MFQARETYCESKCYHSSSFPKLRYHYPGSRGGYAPKISCPRLQKCEHFQLPLEFFDPRQPTAPARESTWIHGYSTFHYSLWVLGKRSWETYRLNQGVRLIVEIHHQLLACLFPWAVQWSSIQYRWRVYTPPWPTYVRLWVWPSNAGFTIPPWYSSDRPKSTRGSSNSLIKCMNT